MLTLRILDEEQIRAMYPWIRDSFPSDERRPLSMMLRLRRRGLYEVLGFYDGGEPVGYALSILPAASRAVLLDYLVVSPDRRGQGLGAAILGLLRGHYASRADGIIIESEDPAQAPEPGLAQRRMGFYARAGAVLLPFRVRLFGVDYAMFDLPTGEVLPDLDWAEILMDIYRQTLPPVFFASQVRLLDD